MPDKRPKTTDEIIKKRGLARWENEGGATKKGHTPKRPDVNQWAKHLVDLATMDDQERAAVRTKKQPVRKEASKPGNSRRSVSRKPL